MSTEACGWALAVLRQISELDPVVGEHSVDAVRNGFHERCEEGGSGPHIGSFDEFDHGELRHLAKSMSTSLRPLYFGMQFADCFADSQLLECTLDTTQNVRAYSARKANSHLVAIVNKSDSPVSVAIQSSFAQRKPAEVKTLTGPSLNALTGVRFSPELGIRKGAITVPAPSATLVIWNR